VRSAILATLAAAVGSPAVDVETLRSVGGLPAHIAGRFTELTVCHQSSDGTWLIFDRRAHTVFSASPSTDVVREVVQIGAEPGRILRPNAFHVAPDGTFVVADAPFNGARVQRFFSNGDNMGGFALPGRQATLVVLDDLILSGVASVIYTGRSVLLSQPDTGGLIAEYALDGQPLRTFGELRRTGHEQDRDLHLALNAGVIAPIPGGGYYFVFVAGVLAFRKYDAAGTLVFERHIEGSELDDYMRKRPATWPRRRTGDGELPVVRPAVRAAAADASSLWVSLDVPYTYVYDNRGDKTRIVQFRGGAGIIAPTSLALTGNGRILVTPGCYLFESRPADKAVR
jgi:hypothetical protein